MSPNSKALLESNSAGWTMAEWFLNAHAQSSGLQAVAHRAKRFSEPKPRLPLQAALASGGAAQKGQLVSPALQSRVFHPYSDSSPKTPGRNSPGDVEGLIFFKFFVF